MDRLKFVYILCKSIKLTLTLPVVNVDYVEFFWLLPK